MITAPLVSYANKNVGIFPVAQMNSSTTWKRVISSSLFLSCFLDILITSKQYFNYNYFSPLLLTRDRSKRYIIKS